MKKEYILLSLVIVFFLFTRLFKITQIPPSLYWDEASIGYNAYSVGLDGKDEWRSFLPLHFRAFGEFKLPTYVYSVAVTEKIFGPGIFSVRIPSVIYSVLSLILLYFITRKLFGSGAAIFSALIFAVSPWNFIFSRTGYEASAGLAFFLLGILLFLISEKKPKFFLLTVLSFILSFYSYNSFRILIPVFLAVFGFIFLLRKDLKIKNIIFPVIIGVVIFLLSLVPVYRLYKLDAGSSRLTQVRAGSGVEIVKNYFSHFSYTFLFSRGDTNPRSNNPGFGELYPVALPFLLIGTYVLIKKRSKYWWLPFLAVITGPIPAAITKDSPHALRSILMFPFLALIAGVGTDYLVNLFKKNKVILTFAITILFLLSFENYFADFLTKYPASYSQEWQYGYREIFENYSSNFAGYNKIVISDQDAQPYIFALYYQKYSPLEFRRSVAYNPVDKWGFSAVSSFGKFVFKKIDSGDFVEGNLVFATDGDKIEDVKPIGEIKNLNGTTAFWVYSK